MMTCYLSLLHYGTGKNYKKDQNFEYYKKRSKLNSGSEIQHWQAWPEMIIRPIIYVVHVDVEMSQMKCKL